VRLNNVHVRFALLAMAIGLAGGLLLIPVNTYAATVAHGIPLLYAPVVGAWLLPVVTSMLSLRRPGAGVLAALVAGFVNIPTTSYGPRALLTMLMVGVFLELAIALTLYRRWDKRTFSLAILSASVLYGLVAWRSLDVGSIGLPAQVAFFTLLILSGQGALIVSAVIARALEDWGVTRGVRGRARSPKAEPVVTDGGWRYDGGSASKPDTTP
jgi:energy-coupling factor transport system substrate-specific component